jgi:beta-phosphoglucomutase-like phosphatase (HAD superfamily)
MDARVFDIDGTLLESFETDCDLFVIAVRKILGVTEINTDWSSYPHVTDQGVVREIMRVNDIEPDQELIEAIEQEFVSSLRAHIDASGPFHEIPGAKEFVSQLVSSEQHYVSYATGAWRASALLKLESAGFPLDGIQVSTSSEHEDRVSIMRGAMAGIPREAVKITYYGDGVWDQAAARELGWSFVPVGSALKGIQHFNDIAV